MEFQGEIELQTTSTVKAVTGRPLAQGQNMLPSKQLNNKKPSILKLPKQESLPTTPITAGTSIFTIDPVERARIRLK